MNCSRCAAVTVEGAAFCGSCGNPLASAAGELPGMIQAGGQPPGSRLPGEESASFGRRLGAYLIDGLILLVIGFVIYFAIALGTGSTTQQEIEDLQDTVRAIAAAVGFVYFWASAASGATAGMRALGVRIISDDGDTGVSLGRGFLRTLVLYLGAIPLFLGWLWMLWDGERQTWHDKASGSRAVHAVKRDVSVAGSPNGQ